MTSNEALHDSGAQGLGPTLSREKKITLPHITYTDRDALDDGRLVDLLDLDIRVHFEGKPITRMTATLFDQLNKYNPGGTVEAQAAAYQALIAFALAGVGDTAGDGEPEGFLFAGPDHHALNDQAVWVQPNDDGWTVMLPSDY